MINNNVLTVTVGSSPGSGISAVPEIVTVSKADHSWVSPICKAKAISLVNPSITWSAFKTLKYTLGYSILIPYSYYGHSLKYKLYWHLLARTCGVIMDFF